MENSTKASAYSDKYCRPVLGLHFLLFLAGCMSGESPEAEPTELELKQAAAQQMFSDFDTMDYTDLGVLPTSGSVSYEGFLSGRLSNTEDGVTDTLIGDLSVNVSFGDSSLISGVASGFLDDNGDALDGAIILSAGELDRAGDPDVDATLTFEGSGELTSISGDVLVFDTDFAGDFLGEEYQGIGGEALAQVAVGGASQSFSGVFAASR
ncbi:hypothetical protein SLH49_19950 [Cognatiyoonia sp. IB215446]|uniref:hypothetical protein n=1 Tax=Cognatiyoonia sp. IB215446 TaxID=3097355 RepID=UPI002A135E0E|nr:hypothetical protein [Cognatiyoonia sp. IB215446]MDX8350271.1 hypothetical protein [Cognatiyoonia sp. IB215446]